MDVGDPPATTCKHITIMISCSKEHQTNGEDTADPQPRLTRGRQTLSIFLMPQVLERQMGLLQGIKRVGLIGYQRNLGRPNQIKHKKTKSDTSQYNIKPRSTKGTISINYMEKPFALKE
jgi:hypothetical protein